MQVVLATEQILLDNFNFFVDIVKDFFVLLNKSNEVSMTHQFKIIVEKHPDGYVAYPLGLKGVVVGQGDTYEK